MNKKLIAVAVAGTIAAPVAYADGHLGITPYGRVNNAIDISDNGDDNNVDLSGVASRFGFKGAGDIGNGMTAIGRYEFSTTTDKEGPGVNDTRLAYVGLQGGFGTITMGNQWSSFFNTVGTYMSPTYSLGYFLYSSVAGLPFRSSNTIKYANSFGPVNLEADIRLNDSGEGGDVAEKLRGNGYGIAGTVSPTDNITLALAWDQEEPQADETGVVAEDEERFGIAGTFGFGNFGINLGWSSLEQGSASGGNAQEVELLQLYLSAGLGDKTTLLVGFGQADNAVANTKPDSWFLGAYYNMGGGLRLWGESTGVSYDDGSDDVTQTLLGMRIDF